jgi:uncharacterized glyoxalase superfamily protein PhnB
MPTSGLPANRSIPGTVVMPVLGVPDVRASAAWLCRAFGFAERLRIGDHRIQLDVPGGGAVVLAHGAPPSADAASSVMVRVADVDAHHRRAVETGARVTSPPTTWPFGERQYSARDADGHAWTFTQSVADVHPSTWGGELVEPPPPAAR